MLISKQTQAGNAEPAPPPPPVLPDPEVARRLTWAEDDLEFGDDGDDQ